jgi:hypothetical protein
MLPNLVIFTRTHEHEVLACDRQIAKLTRTRAREAATALIDWLGLLLQPLPKKSPTAITAGDVA